MDPFGLAKNNRTLGFKECSDLLKANAGDLARGLLADEKHDWQYYKRDLNKSKAQPDHLVGSPMDYYDKAKGYHESHQNTCRSSRKSLTASAKYAVSIRASRGNRWLPLINARYRRPM